MGAAGGTLKSMVLQETAGKEVGRSSSTSFRPAFFRITPRISWQEEKQRERGFMPWASNWQAVPDAISGTCLIAYKRGYAQMQAETLGQDLHKGSGRRTRNASQLSPWRLSAQVREPVTAVLSRQTQNSCLPQACDHPIWPHKQKHHSRALNILLTKVN